MIYGLIFAALVWLVLTGASAVTLWVLATLFGLPVTYSIRELLAAAILNVMLGWLGAGPWFLGNGRRS
jgi:hypothetical protein